MSANPLLDRHCLLQKRTLQLTGTVYLPERISAMFNCIDLIQRTDPDL
jgi:hypothetical protein